MTENTRKTFRPAGIARSLLTHLDVPFQFGDGANVLTIQIGDTTYTMITYLGMPEDVVQHPDGMHLILVYPRQPDDGVPVVQCRIDGASLVAEKRGVYRPTADGWYALEDVE